MNEDPDSKNPDFAPGEDVHASVRRIQLWMKQHPDDVNVAGQIGSSNEFISPGWPYRMYAVDYRDLAAVLRYVQNLPQVQVYTHEDGTCSTVCEACDSNITHGDLDPRLADLVEAAAGHICDLARKAAVAEHAASRKG
jgi:hypothetical protein